MSYCTLQDLRDRYGDDEIIQLTDRANIGTIDQTVVDRAIADADGEIDGFVGPRWPKCFGDGHPNIVRLFADSVQIAEDYYRRHSVFPIMHVLGLRRSLAEAHPWLPGALLKGFTKAKVMAQEALVDTSATKVTMPFVEDNLARAHQLMGPDLWTYGLAPNVKVLETFLRYHHAQGLSPRRVDVNELFHPATIEAYSL